MGNILTNWKLDFGETGEKISAIVKAVLGLEDAVKKASDNSTADYKKVTNALDEQNAKLREATAARAREQSELEKIRGVLKGLQSDYKALDTAKNRASEAGVKALEQNLRAQKSIKGEIKAITKDLELETKAVNEATEAVKRETEAQKKLAQEAKNAAKAQQPGSGGGGALKPPTSEMGGFAGAIDTAATAFAGFFAINKLKQLGEEIIAVTAEFEKYEAVLTTVFDGNNEKAKRTFAYLEDYATRTPFQIDEITDAYVQLQQRGINPTQKQLIALGDLAASSGKSFEAVTLAVLNAQTGIYRNLKQFGVTAEADGNKVKLTFKGVTTELEKGSDALKEYLLNLGATNGIAGSTERISATLGGQISNLKDNFTQLFAVMGEGGAGPVSYLIGKLSDLTKQIKNYLKSDDAKAIEASTAGIVAYGEVVTTVFEETAKTARASGDNVNDALRFAMSGQEAQLDTQLVLAEKRAKKATELFENAKKHLGLATFLGSALPTLFPGLKSNELAEAQKLNIEEQAHLKLLRGEKDELRERYKVATEGTKNELDKLGLILALKKKIERLDEIREAKSTTRAQLLNKGGLNDQKKALEAELAILEGKEKKTKEHADRLTAALKALQEAELQLRKKYNSQLEAEAKDNATKLADIQLKNDLEELARMRATIIEKERLVKKAGGKGVDADGKLDPQQQKEYNTLVALAQQSHADKLAAIERETNKRILDLREESDQKQLDELNAKFAEEIRVAKKAENQKLVDALEAAQKRQTVQLLLTQQLRQIDERQALATNAAKLGHGVVGAFQNEQEADTEQDPAKLTKTQRFFKTLADARIDIEKNLQRQLLEIQINGDKERLEALKSDGTAATEIRRQAIKVSIEDGEKQLGQLKLKTDAVGFLMNLLGVAPKDQEKTRAAFEEFAGKTLEQVQEFTQANAQAATAAHDDAKERTQNKREELQTEIDLNKQGFASNVEARRAELVEAKRAQAEALKDKKAALKTQILLDTALQASGLITSSVKIIEGFAGIPIVGPALGIAAVTAMIGFFLAAKAKAYQAVNSQTLEKGGFIGGRRHYEGGNKYVSADGSSTVEHEAGEFVVARKPASKYAPLLEAVNKDDESRIMYLLVNDLLKGTGVVAPSPKLPERLEAAQASHHAATAQAQGGGAHQELAKLRQDVAAIRENTQPQATAIDAGDRIIYRDGTRTRIELKPR